MTAPQILYQNQKMVWRGDFTRDSNFIKRNTSINYLFTFKGAKSYMLDFGQPIEMLLNKSLEREEYIKYIRSFTFQIDLETITESLRKYE